MFLVNACMTVTKMLTGGLFAWRMRMYRVIVHFTPSANVHMLVAKRQLQSEHGTMERTLHKTPQLVIRDPESVTNTLARFMWSIVSGWVKLLPPTCHNSSMALPPQYSLFLLHGLLKIALWLNFGSASLILLWLSSRRAHAYQPSTQPHCSNADLVPSFK
jgi:hypothetical protein